MMSPASLTEMATFSNNCAGSSPEKASFAVDEELRREAERLDDQDELRKMRGEFVLPAGRVYLCGQSLGPLPRAALAAVEAHLEKWGSSAVDGHFSEPEAWATLEEEASLLSMDVVGAKHAHEVAIMNSLTVNLHLLLTAFYQPHGARDVVLVEENAFSSDEYALQTHLHTRGIDADSAIIRLRPRLGETLLRNADILNMIRDLHKTGRLALVLFPGVQFYTGQVFPMAEVSKLCQELGIPLGLDLAHAVGNIPLYLHDWGVDFAVWCNYKYLNSGPGAVGGAFVHTRHAHAPLRRLGGWWGHDRRSRFCMPRVFEPQAGARGLQLSNPPVLAMAPVTASLRVLRAAGGVSVTRRKSIALTAFLQRALHARLPHRVDITSPLHTSERGAQLSLRFIATPERELSATQVNNALAECNIICDVREPDVIRVAPAPLFNSFHDVCLFVCTLEHVLTVLDPNN